MHISEILPAGLAAAEIRGCDPDAQLLSPERAALGEVRDKRLREFTAGRTCARRALGRLGIPPYPVLIGARRQPLWPPDIVGSITHCDGYCAAVVGPNARFCAVGIDAEINDELPEGTLDLIVRADERPALEKLPRASGVCWDRLTFSAKESVFKAFSPIAGEWLGFEDVVVTFDCTGGFVALLRVRGPFRAVAGSYGVFGAHLVTAVVVPAASLALHPQDSRLPSQGCSTFTYSGP
jgi:4'-phosphopantetheinyl transferase EntD